jgi:isoquinoline 1-oxidoreductase
MAMNTNQQETRYESITTADGQIIERVRYDFGMTRRGFVQVLGAGIVIATAASGLAQQQRGGRGGRGGGLGGAGAANIASRLHIGADGIITVLTGKVEGGQGSRTEISQTAADELRVPLSQIKLIMADTELCPDDGPSYGSRTTPSTLPAVRAGCAAARSLLLDVAAKSWNVSRDAITMRDGKAVDASGNRSFGYADLAASDASTDAFKAAIPRDITVTPVAEWNVQGKPALRPNSRDLVSGAHGYPSAVLRPGMLYGKVLRAPSYGATLKSVDVSAAKTMSDVVVVHDRDFVAVAAPTTHQAKLALAEIEKTAQWERPAQVSSADLPRHLRQNARGGIPENSFTEELKSAAKTVKASFDVAYVQHAPMEPRAAVAEWDDGKVTVWTATQNPWGVRNELSQRLNTPAERVRVIIPDFGGAFGGKHTGETAVEAARIAQAAGKPVAVRWTREEEFTWAAFRPAAAIDIQATLDASGKLTSWHYITINPGNPGMESPYTVAKNTTRALTTDAPLRQASYRALGATANHFAREVFMDELANAAGKDPLAFRLMHLENPRMRAVLEEAARQFNWETIRTRSQRNAGTGLAVGTDKGSVVATCAEVVVDPASGKVTVKRLVQAFECGAIVNPLGLRSQVQGAMIQGLGPALREAMEFEDGVMINPAFSSYKVPRFADLPQIDIHLMNRPDLPSAGAGETPLISVAPAIANAVAQAIGRPVRTMPIRVAPNGNA